MTGVERCLKDQICTQFKYCTLVTLCSHLLLIGFNFHKPVPAARDSKPYVSCDMTVKIEMCFQDAERVFRTQRRTAYDKA